MTRARLQHEYVHTPERNEGRTEVMKIVSRPPWSRGMLQEPQRPPSTHFRRGSTSMYTSSPQGLGRALNGGKPKIERMAPVIA